jgi:ankyrin repeat protein
MWKKLEPTEKLFAIHDKRMSVWDSSWDWAENFIKEFKTAYEDALKAAGHLHSPSSVVDLNGLSTKLLDAELHSVDSNNAEELPRLITHYEKKGDFLMAQILQERLLSADSENSRLDSETVLIICNLLALYGIVSDEIEQVARRLGLNTTMMTKIAPPIHRTVAQNNKRLMTMFLRHRMSEETDFVGRSVYHAAMENRASSSLEVLLALKGSKGLNGKDLFERQPLCVAAEFGFEDCLRLIHNPVAHIDLSANATWYKDGKLVKAGKWNPLHIAAQHGHLGMVQRLLAAGMDVNALAAYRSGRTALQAASEAGYAPLVRFLLNSGADINAPAASEDGLTALQAVAMRGDLQLVTLFINAGAKVNASPGESGGRTALQAAAQNGHLHVCELLLTKGAHINAKPAEFDGRTALQAAAQGGHEKIVHMLHRKGAYINAPASPGGLTAVQAAAKGGSIEVVRFLIQHNADIDAAAEPNRGLTALEAAAENGHIEMVRLLITMGARVHHPAPVGKPTWKWLGTTAIQAAAISGDIEVVHELLKKGADVNARAPGECAIVTPLQAAASHGQLELTQFLISQGADINSPASNNSGFTALQAAAEGGHLAVVNFLLEKCADVNAPPSKYHGKTALQAAAANGHVKIVRALLNAGADIDGTGTVGCDYERTSVIDSAIGRGNVGIVKLLLEVNDGSDKICMDEALRLAVNTGHEVIAEMLKSYGAADATAEYT